MPCSIKSEIRPGRWTAKGIIRRVGLTLTWILLISGCGRGPKSPALNLPVFFTCDTEGRLEPCGCFVGQFGGLTRLKTMLDSEAPAEALRVDVGDSIGGREDYDVIEYHFVLRAFAAMHYDALNVGQREAQLSLAQLREIKRTSPVPILSANLLDKATGRPVFDSYRIVRRGAFRIAIVGVLDPRGLQDNLGAGLAVGDMESAVERSLVRLRGRADLVVLLAFTDETTLRRLAQEFYECQVILGGNVSQPAQELYRVNRSLVYYVTNESKDLGILRLLLTRGGPLQVTGHEIQLLTDQIHQDPGFQKLESEYREEIRHTHLAVDDPNHLSADMVPGVHTAATYVGTSTCITCHKSAGAVWAASAHAHAFAALVTRHADADPKCIGCHTVGFSDPSGYRRQFGANKLVNVGCESCHGPGSLHVREEEGDHSIHFTFRPLFAGDCRKCHHGEFTRPFDWNEFWPRIKHGKEPQRSAAMTTRFQSQ